MRKGLEIGGVVAAVVLIAMADRLSIFGIVIGIALLLTGIGFAVLVAGGAVRNPDTVLKFLRSHGHRHPTAQPS